MSLLEVVVSVVDSNIKVSAMEIKGTSVIIVCKGNLYFVGYIVI